MLYRRDEPAAAFGDYELFLKKYPSHRLAAFARMGIGYCREDEGKWEEAIQAYRTIASNYPASSLIPESLVAVARCLSRLDRIPEAINSYREVISQYPRSAYARVAREEMVDLLSRNQGIKEGEAGEENLNLTPEAAIDSVRPR